MKAHHSGIAGRTERQKRHILTHIKKGLCAYCSNPISNKSKYRCDYHLEYERRYKKKKENSK